MCTGCERSAWGEGPKPLEQGRVGPACRGLGRKFALGSWLDLWSTVFLWWSLPSGCGVQHRRLAHGMPSNTSGSACTLGKLAAPISSAEACRPAPRQTLSPYPGGMHPPPINRGLGHSGRMPLPGNHLLATGFIAHRGCVAPGDLQDSTAGAQSDHRGLSSLSPRLLAHHGPLGEPHTSCGRAHRGPSASRLRCKCS